MHVEDQIVMTVPFPPAPRTEQRRDLPVPADRAVEAARTPDPTAMH
ncbi:MULTISPECIES: hypothetical protein [unclassified Streptomyces]|nr:MULTISPECIES: hypothetical protein [unclassified Streptomyces]MCM1965402.1 hypothetical protein [Streptomyces sp. G1]MCX5130062.1 hypothetical protein [Streptomyces sp. NBC_00347]MCX5301100.1 hypothetical protein [Streptomyces sp. NBC_00193]